MSDILIDQELRSIIPPLSEEEYSELETSLICEGNRVPIDTWRGYIIDGHHRYDICHKHGIPLKPASELTFATKDDVIEWIIRNQFARRNLNLYQRSRLMLKLEPIIAARAKAKQIATQLIGKGIQRQDMVPQNSAEPLASVETREELAKLAHVSHDTIDKVKVIQEKATPEQKAMLDSGETSVNQVFTAIKTGKPIATKWTGDHENYTPSIYIEAARTVMGSIDCDPASCEQAQEIVKAKIYYTSEDDGLRQDWKGNIFINPPYSHPLVYDFVSKLLLAVKAGQQAILLTNNNTDTAFFHEAAKEAALLCFTKGRINFYKHDGERTSPTNGQIFYYFGSNTQKFKEVFGAFGILMRVV